MTLVSRRPSAIAPEYFPSGVVLPGCAVRRVVYRSLNPVPLQRLVEAQAREYLKLDGAGRRHTEKHEVARLHTRCSADRLRQGYLSARQDLTDRHFEFLPLAGDCLERRSL